MRPLVTSLLILIIGGWPCRGQEPESRPATRPAAEVTAHEWAEWMEGLQPKAEADPFLLAESETSRAGFTAARLADCGARPAFERKGEKPSLLQRVPYVVAGFDPKQTYIASLDSSRPVCIYYGAGLGVRGAEQLDATGPVRGYQGDATSERVNIPKPVGLDELGPLGKIIKDAGGRLERPITFEVKDHVVFAVPLNNSEHPESVPKFARGLRARGARAVLFVDDRGVDKTIAPVAVVRRDRFRRPVKEDPPALFLTENAALRIGRTADVKLAVRYRVKELDIPNVVGKVGPDAPECVVLGTSAGGGGHATAILLAATRILARMPGPSRRPVVVAIASRPDSNLDGQAWLLSNPPVALPKIVAAVHIGVAQSSTGKEAPGPVEIVTAGRSSPELRARALDALSKAGFAGTFSNESPNAGRAVDAWVDKGIPAIGLAVTPGTFEEGLVAARVAAALTRALQDLESRPVLPGK